MNLSEESKGGASPSAGKGAFWAMVNLIFIFVIMMIVVLIAMTDEEIAKANTNILYAIANALFPKPWNYLAVFSTILSTLGTIETQILQFSRGMFAMARDGMLHSRYATIHPKWKTPWVSTAVICVLGLVLLFSSTYLPSVKAILQSSIDAIGLQICFYMSLTGFACAWRYRDRLRSGPVAAVSFVLWPLASSVFMVFLAVYSIPTFDRVTNIMGIGGLLAGFVPLYLARGRRPATR
jgi:amino acid transporter